MGVGDSWRRGVWVEEMEVGGANSTKADELCHNFIMKYMILYIKHTNKETEGYLWLFLCQIVHFDNLSSLELDNVLLPRVMARSREGHLFPST